LSAADLKRRREQLAEWWNGSKLADGQSFWNEWLYQLMTRELPWRRMGISPWMQATLFTNSRVMIEGTKRSDNNFVVPKKEWVRDGLEAYLTLQTRPLPEKSLDFHRYRLMRMIRKLMDA